MRVQLTRPIALDVAIIFSVWLLLLLSFVLLGSAGQGTGLQISTMGEDQNWVALLAHDSWHDIASSFWAIDSRNPMSPWFYIAAKPLILGLSYGLGLLQNIVGLLLAISSYFLLLILTNWRGRLFALTSAVIISVNISNAYFDHIIWNFQIALICSIISIICYLIYLESARTATATYGLSLCFWCLALHTYTLQSGAIVAIAICQLKHCLDVSKNAGLAGGLLRHLCSAALDLVPFVVILCIFVLTWITTSRLNGSLSYYFSTERLLASLFAGLFHQDISLAVNVLKASTNKYTYLIVAGFSSIIVAAAIGCMLRNHREILKASCFALVILVALSIALPTIVLESGGTDWSPGSRWRMIYQFTTPVILMSLFGISVCLFAQAKRSVFLVLFAGLFAWSLAAAFAYNERQVQLSRSESLVREAIRVSLIGKREDNARPLLAVVVIEDSFRWFATSSLWAVYMKTWFPEENIIFRLLPSQKYIPASVPTKLSFTLSGIEVDQGSGGVLVPYSRVLIMHAFDQTVSREAIVSRKEVIEHNGDWRLLSDQIVLEK